jgi:hypothetical protein
MSLHPYFCLFTSSELMCFFSHVGHCNDICCILCKYTYITFLLLNDELTLLLLLSAANAVSKSIDTFSKSF